MRVGVQGVTCGYTTLHIYRSAIYFLYMDASEMGKRGAAVTNKILTTEQRKKAAKKGWKLRKQRIKDLQDNATR